MAEKLFISDLTPSDEYYRIIRDEDRVANLKSYMECLWKIYRPYADRDFRIQLSQDFHARFWEMYLTCTLLSHSINVTSKQNENKGPDILINDSQRKIYLEAVTPSPGADDNPDKIPDSKYNTFVAECFPENEITLRYCSAIADKYKKYRTYLEQGIITPSDAYVIALNSCKIDVRAKVRTSEFPLIMKAVLPIGNKTVKIDRLSREIESVSYQYRPEIIRLSGSSVPTDLFIHEDYAGISGILYAHVDIANIPEQAGSEYNFIHNPKSIQNAVPNDYFRFGVEYFVSLEPDTFSISWNIWNIDK